MARSASSTGTGSAPKCASRRSRRCTLSRARAMSPDRSADGGGAADTRRASPERRRSCVEHPDAHPDCRGRDDHPARPPRVAREERLRRGRRGEGRRGGGRPRAERIARPRPPRRQDAEAGRHRRRPPDPRGVPDPDRDGDRIRRAGAGRRGPSRPASSATSSSPSASRICSRRSRPRARATTSSRPCARRRPPSPTRSPPARQSSARRGC